MAIASKFTYPPLGIGQANMNVIGQRGQAVKLDTGPFGDHGDYVADNGIGLLTWAQAKFAAVHAPVIIKRAPLYTGRAEDIALYRRKLRANAKFSKSHGGVRIPDSRVSASEEFERLWFKRLRAMKSWQKVHMVARLSQQTRELALAGLRMRYPDASKRELRLRLAAIRFDRETMIRAFGWDPQAHP